MALLAFNLNDGNEFVFDLTEERMGLGRASDNTIIINNSYISGHHAEFRRLADGAYELSDLDSSNGVRVNGKRIQRAILKDLDKVAFGQLDGRYYQEGTLADREKGGGGISVKSAPVAPTAMTPKGSGVLAQLRAGKGGMAEPKAGMTVPAGTSEAASRAAMPMPVTVVAVMEEGTVPIRKLAPVEFKAPGPAGAGVAKKGSPRTRVKKSTSEAMMNGETAPLAEVNLELERERVIAERKLEEIEEKLNRRADELLEIEKTIGDLGGEEERVKAEGLRLKEEREKFEVEKEGERGRILEKGKREVEALRAAFEREKVAFLGENSGAKLELEQARAGLAALVREREDAEVAVTYLEDKQGKLEERVAELDRVRVEREAEEVRKAEILEEIAEVEDRVASLKAQEKALETARAEGEENLEHLLKAKGSRLKELGRELKEEEGRMKAEGLRLKGELEGMEKELAQRRVDVEEQGRMKAEGLRLKEELEGLGETLKVEGNRVEEVKRERVELEVAMAEVAARLKELEGERKTAREALDGEKGAVVGSIGALRGEEEDLARMVGELRGEVTELKGAMKKMEGERREAASDLEAVKGKLEEEKRERERVAAELAEMVVKRVAAEGVVREVEEKRAAVEAELERVEEGLVRSRREAEAKAVELEAELKRSLENLEGEKGAVMGAIAELRVEEGGLRAALEGLLGNREEGNRMVSKLRAEVEQMEGERRRAASAFEVKKGEAEEMDAVLVRLREEERAVRKSAEEAKEWAGKADGLRREISEMEGRVAGLKAEAEKLDGEAKALSMADAVNAVRFAKGIMPDEDPAKVLERKVAEAEEEAKRLRAEASSEAEAMKLEAGRYRKKSREYRRMEKEIKRGEKRALALENRALKALEKAAAAAALREEEKVLRKTLAGVRQEVEQAERSVRYLKEKEAREKAVVAEVEGELVKLKGMRKDMEGEIEKVRLDMANLPEEGQKLRDIRNEIGEAEAKVEGLRAETAELEAKRELMGQAENLEEATVLLLGRELIKRLDLVDTMVNHYRYYEANPGVEEQLETFRSSMLDMLVENSIRELAPKAGTKVDIKLRKQMKIVETEGSGEVAKVVETMRPGYVFVGEGGREIVLRKVEVRTG